MLPSQRLTLLSGYKKLLSDKNLLFDPKKEKASKVPAGKMNRVLCA